MDKKGLIAPCGINCGVCRAYLRSNNKCPGCRGDDSKKPITRTRCKIKTCEFFTKKKGNFCFECDKFPCQEIERLDKRYKTKYTTSLIENLATIKEKGIGSFLKNEEKKWKCDKCGGTICMHNQECSSCNKVK